MSTNVKPNVVRGTGLIRNLKTIIMIEANSLRLKNWVKDLNGKYCRIETIDSDGYDVYFLEHDTLSYLPNSSAMPITLNSELLEKIGFKRIDHVHGYSFYSLSSSKKNKCHIDIYPEKTSWMSYSVNHCKYLHELQNLYYSLTGSELEVIW